MKLGHPVQHEHEVNLSSPAISKYLASVALKPQTAKPPALRATAAFAFPQSMFWGGTVWGSRTGVQRRLLKLNAPTRPRKHMRCAVVLKRHFGGGGTQTAKPSAVRSQRLSQRPQTLPCPHFLTHGIGRVVELAVKPRPRVEGKGTLPIRRIAPLTARGCDLRATLKRNYIFAAGWK